MIPGTTLQRASFRQERSQADLIKFHNNTDNVSILPWLPALALALFALLVAQCRS